MTSNDIFSSKYRKYEGFSGTRHDACSLLNLAIVLRDIISIHLPIVLGMITSSELTRLRILVG